MFTEDLPLSLSFFTDQLSSNKCKVVQMFNFGLKAMVQHHELRWQLSILIKKLSTRLYAAAQ